MFEKIVLRRSDAGPALTAGELAEALLFYQNVHLFLDHGSLWGLVDQIGMPMVLELLDRPGVSAVYTEQMLATYTESYGTYGTHSFQAITVSGDQKTGALNTKRERFTHHLERKGYKRSEARKYAERFRKKVPFRELTGNHFVSGGILNAALNDLRDPKFVHEAIRRVVCEITGEKAFGPFDFEVFTENQNFRIYTDLDFAALSAAQKARTGNEVTEANLLTVILDASADTILAAHYGGDFYTSETTSQIVQVRHQELLRRAGLDREELKEFREIVISDVPSLRDVINSKQRSFGELLDLVDKSARFRIWTRGQNPDEKLVQSYLRDVTLQGWAEKLPTKALRYVIGSVLGAVEPITGLAASAADTFVLSKILRGWMPSHFVERHLKPFLSSDPIRQ